MKDKLKKIINEYKLMSQTEFNLAQWGFTWETATPDRIRICAIDAFFHAMRFASHFEREKYILEEFKFIESVALAIGIVPCNLYKIRGQVRGGNFKLIK